MTKLFAHVLIEDVVAHGGQPAIVLAQLRFKLHAVDHEPGERPWYTPPPKRKDGTSELQRLTGLSGSQVRRAMDKLIQVGAVEAVQLNASKWDQRMSYRPAVPIEDPPVCRDDESGDSRDDDSGTSRDDESGTSSIEGSSKDSSIKPPYPPEGGEEEGDPPKLFDEPPLRADNKRVAEEQQTPASVLGDFKIWWPNYPPGKKGLQDSALRAFRKKVLKEHWTADELHRRLDNYRQSRINAAKRFGASTADVPLMNGSKFLNQCVDDFDHVWEGEELDYWKPAFAAKAKEQARAGSSAARARVNQMRERAANGTR